MHLIPKYKLLFIKQFILFATLLLSSLSSFCYANDSIGFYYNSIDSARELINYQRVVINPSSVNQRQLKTLHTAGTQVFAYLSIGEFSGKQLPEKLKSATLMENKDWQSKVMDLTHPAWRQYLKSLANDYIKRGFDGLFLDTLDSYLLFSQELKYKKSQEQALISMIDQLNQLQPSPEIIINRGFDIVSRIKSPIHALVVESMHHGYQPIDKKYYKVKSEDTEWLKTKLNMVKKLGIEVIVIDYLPSTQRNDQIAEAKQLLDDGYTPYVSDGLLMELGVSTIVPVPKRVLIFYDANVIRDNNSECHRLLSMPLEYLGYVPECVDVNKFKYSSIDLTKYAAVISWLDYNANPNLQELQAWLATIINKRPVLFVGSLPNNTNILKKIGIKEGDDLSGHIRTTKGKNWYTKHPPIFSPFEKISQWDVTSSTTESLIEIKDEKDRKSSLFITGPWGGAILSPLPILVLLEVTSWNIDPFKLISKTLNLPPIPAADATTESGRRILTIHIDGDGFPSRASFSGRPYVSEIILNKILKPSKYPHTVSVIEGEVGKRGLYPEQSNSLEKIARKIFRLPNIEAATHTFSHPFFWRDVDIEVKQKEYGNHLAIPGYKLDYVNEIVGSSEYMNKRLLPKDKKVKLVLWSGSADPKESEIKIAEDAGLLNVNGGNTFILKEKNDLSRIYPTILWYPSGIQVYAPTLNENVYTSLWNEHFDGYARVIESFNLLNHPRRLKSVGVYYHMYSGTYPASVNALKKIYTWADSQPLTPLYLSEYAQRARTLYETGLAKDLKGHWVISSTGIKSIRLPLQLGTPNMSSSNIAGWKKESNGRYLIPYSTRTKLSLNRKKNKNSASEMRLDSANAQLKKWNKRGKITEWSFKAHTPLEFEISNAENCIVKSKIKPTQTQMNKTNRQYKFDKTGVISGTITCHNQ